MNDGEKAATEQELTQYRRTVDGRDEMVRRANKAGVSKHRIHVLTGIARTTIDRILLDASHDRMLNNLSAVLDTEAGLDELLRKAGPPPADAPPDPSKQRRRPPTTP